MFVGVRPGLKSLGFTASFATFVGLYISKHAPRVDGIALNFSFTSSEFDHEYANYVGWHNMGLFDQSGECTKSIDGYFDFTACNKNLARKLAHSVHLQPGDQVIDVGVGQGLQDHLFVNEFNVKQIQAFNIGRQQVTQANALLQTRPVLHHVRERITFAIGDAVNLPVKQCSANKVLSLESAMHYRTREDFMRESFRVLCSGGILGIADVIPVSVTPRCIQMFDAISTSAVPKENQYDATTYTEKLLAIGFHDVSLQDITSDVVTWPGSPFYSAFRETSFLKEFRKQTDQCPYAYMIFTARKP